MHSFATSHLYILDIVSGTRLNAVADRVQLHVHKAECSLTDMYA